MNYIAGTFVFFMSISALSASQFEQNIVFKGEEIVWGFDFMPSGKIILTEKEGQLKIHDVKTNTTSQVKSVPKVDTGGQGGLLDILLDKDYSKNRKLYLTYSVPIDGDHTTRLISAELVENKLENIQILLTALPATSKTQHYGSRVLQDKNGFLFVTVGDRGERELAQDKSKMRGKLYRVSPNGKVELWTYGHRNAQGASFHPETQQLWTVEHGPRGGDEINVIEKGKNYGWPVITYGKEYWGPSIGEGTSKKGMEQPKYYYVPSIATSGLMIYSGKMFKEWKNNFFVGALKDTHISHLKMINGKLKEVGKLFQDKAERIRQIKEAPDGSIYYSTDNGKIIRLFKKLKGKG